MLGALEDLLRTAELILDLVDQRVVAQCLQLLREGLLHRGVRLQGLADSEGSQPTEDQREHQEDDEQCLLLRELAAALGELAREKRERALERHEEDEQDRELPKQVEDGE